MKDVFVALKKQVYWLIDFLWCVIKQFEKDACLTTSTALAYSSLFSLMPILIIGYSVFSGFPEFELLGPKVEALLLNNFVPEVAEDIRRVGQSFMQQASELSLTGFLGLLMVALWMIYTIEQSFNQIWHVRKQRDSVAAFLMYWAVITLTPILLASGISISSHISSWSFMADSANQSSVSSMWLMLKYILTGVFFSLLYFLVPNCKVRVVDALIGGAVALLLFEISKWALVVYVARFTSYKFLYGAVAALPIFLLWLYIFWFILLFGAQITHMAGLFRQGKRSA